MPTRATKTRAAGTSRAGTKRRVAKKTGSGSTGGGRTASGRTASGRSRTRGAAHRSSHGKRKWSAGVNTESTYPQEGLFKKDAETIARSLASKRISPKGPASGMRMLTFYVNRAGKNLSKSRLRVLEHAKELLHERVETMKGRTGKQRSATRRRSHGR